MSVPRPTRLPTDNDEAFLLNARVARLATTDAKGTPSCVPVVFVWDGKRIIVPVDRKPKQVGPHALKRVRNIKENPKVALVVDEYAEDWSLLRYLMVRGTAGYGPPEASLIGCLRGKYPQYETMEVDGIITIVPEKFIGWKGSLPPPASSPPGQ